MNKVKNNTNVSDFLRINIGPWDRLTLENSTKMGIIPQPETVNFYPGNMFAGLDNKDSNKKGDENENESKNDKKGDSAKDKFAALLKGNFKDDKNKIDLANGYFSVLSNTRNKDGNIEIIPYNIEYKKYIRLASEYLKNAANCLVKDEKDNNNKKHEAFIKFLLKRSENFLNDKYAESDELWILCDDDMFDVTIGPYEVYEDHILCKKACFESFVCLKDIDSSKDLQTFKKYLQKLEDNLPNDSNNDKYVEWKRNANVKPNYIVAVNQIGRGGDCAGPQTAAFNLPNDESVTAKYGNKLVILKNIQKLKFKYVLEEITKVAIVKEQQKFVQFNSFFTHILCHEMCHSLGPHNITLANGKETTVRYINIACFCYNFFC